MHLCTVPPPSCFGPTLPSLVCCVGGLHFQITACIIPSSTSAPRARNVQRCARPLTNTPERRRLDPGLPRAAPMHMHMLCMHAHAHDMCMCMHVRTCALSTPQAGSTTSSSSRTTSAARRRLVGAAQEGGGRARAGGVMHFFSSSSSTAAQLHTAACIHIRVSAQG